LCPHTGEDNANKVNPYLEDLNELMREKGGRERRKREEKRGRERR
jgi:hypothetical protein